MTKAPERAFAAAILEEVAAEKRWSRAFAENSGALERLVDGAIADDSSRKTVPLDPDEI
jgi:hypothetical protein